MKYKMNIAGLERELPLCPITDNLYIAGFILFGDVELTKACAENILGRVKPFDVILTAESKGIPFAYELARSSGKPYVVARKGPKLYMQDVEIVEICSSNPDGVQTLCVGRDEKKLVAGKRVLVVDDVVSTGDSLLALETLAKAIGGLVTSKCAILAEDEAADRDDIVFIERLPLFDGEGNPI